MESYTLGRLEAVFRVPRTGPPPKKHERHTPKARGQLEERHSAWTGLSTGPGFLPPHVPWDPTSYPRSARRSLVYAFNFRKKILYGDFEKATHRHTNQLRFCTFFSDLVRIAPPPPQGARGGPGGPGGPGWPTVGRCQAQVLEPPQQPPGPARSPTPLPRPPRRPRPGRWHHSTPPGPRFRIVPGRRPGRAWPWRYGPLKPGDATRKPGDATRKRSRPAVSGRPRPSQAGPRRLRPPAALLRPPRYAVRGGGAKRARSPVPTTLARKLSGERVQSTSASHPPWAQAVTWALAGRAAPRGRQQPLRRILRAQGALARPVPARRRAAPAR